MGGALSRKETFTPCNSIIGQSISVLEVASVCNLSKHEVDVLWRAFVRLETEGIPNKVVISYLLTVLGSVETPFGRALMKLWDDKLFVPMLSFEEYLQVSWAFLTLDDATIPMFIFRLFDIGHRNYFDKPDVKFLVHCIWGPGGASATADVRTALNHVDNLHDAVDKDEFLTYLAEHPIVLQPIYELKRSLANRNGGERMWLGHLEHRTQKMFEKFATNDFDADDFLFDEACHVRFLRTLNYDMPSTMRGRFDAFEAKYEAQIADMEARKHGRKMKKKQESMLDVLVNGGRRLTATVTHNKYLQALAFKPFEEKVKPVGKYGRKKVAPEDSVPNSGGGGGPKEGPRGGLIRKISNLVIGNKKSKKKGESFDFSNIEDNQSSAHASTGNRPAKSSNKSTNPRKNLVRKISDLVLGGSSGKKASPKHARDRNGTANEEEDHNNHANGNNRHHHHSSNKNSSKGKEGHFRGMVKRISGLLSSDKDASSKKEKSQHRGNARPHARGNFGDEGAELQSDLNEFVGGRFREHEEGLLNDDGLIMEAEPKEKKEKKKGVIKRLSGMFVESRFAKRTKNYKVSPGD